MSNTFANKLAITCMSGGYKSVFTQGVLDAFESKNLFADTYAGCSSSALVSTLAACREVKQLGLSIWTDGLRISSIEGNSQSNAILHSIEKIYPLVKNKLWSESSSRLIIATSYVNNQEAESITQTDKARRFGQKLLIEAMKNISGWKDENLDLHLFDTCPHALTKLITSENFKEVLYASTRMLHAWHIPAVIDGEPYIDGSYTSLCPVIELTEIGDYDNIICVLTDHENRSINLFSNEQIPNKIGDTNIHFIQPDMNLKDIGVDFYSASEDGFKQAFSHGVMKAMKFIDQ